MQITEADRLDMLAELRRCHGERIGDIIVEHLPPAGWGDLARQADIARLDGRINHLAGAMWALAGIMTAGFTGLFALIASKL